MFSPTKSEIALEHEKQNTVAVFSTMWTNPDVLLSVCTKECSLQPPGAPPLPVEEMMTSVKRDIRVLRSRIICRDRRDSRDVFARRGPRGDT